MKIGVNTNCVQISAKMKNIAINDVGSFKNQLDKIRTGLDGAYKGRENLTADILTIEKKIDEFSSKLSTLSRVFDQCTSDILREANNAVEIGQLAPLSNQLDFILSNPTTAQMIERNNLILLAQNYSEKYKNGLFGTSPLTRGIAASLFAGASTAALLPLLNTNNSAEGVDNWFKENTPEEYKIAQSGEYRYKADSVNNAFGKPQTQLYENGGGGNCHVAAMTRLLNRKSYLDGHGTSTFTPEDVYSAGGATNIKKIGNYRSGIKYSYKGSTGGNVPKATYTVGDVSYQAHKVKSIASKAGGADSYMTSLLNDHPEGVCVRTNGHVAVITDYEIIDGKVQYYVSDSFTKSNGISQSGRIKIEDSSLYKGVSSSTAFYNMKSFDYISYLT